MNLNFKDSGGRIIISLEVLTFDASSEWREGLINFELGGFSACFNFHFMKMDFGDFYENLILIDRKLHGVASLNTIEGNLSLSITIDQVGHLAVRGHLIHPSFFGLRTNFEFESDQTFLREMILETSSLLKS